MSTEAFARAKIDALLKDVGWKLTDGKSVRFEYTTGEGNRVDYLLADRHGRSMAVVEAKRASINPVEAEGQALRYAKELDAESQQFVSEQMAAIESWVRGAGNGLSVFVYTDTGFGKTIRDLKGMVTNPVPDSPEAGGRTIVGLDRGAPRSRRFHECLTAFCDEEWMVTPDYTIDYGKIEWVVNPVPAP